MMNDCGKSDKSVVPEKQPNNDGVKAPSAEEVEGRDLTEGNSPQQNTHRTQCRESVPSALMAIRKAAKADKRMRFTALFHHVYNVENLRTAFFALKRNVAAGIDGETWQSYEEQLEENLCSLSERLKRGAFRAKPVKRVYIPKPDGKQRPLGIPSLEDKIVQKAMVEVLNAIYEADFLGFSYGFRPGKSPHNALDALYVGLLKRKVNWVFDADLRDFFNTIDHEWMIKFVEHRIADRRIVRLIQKWLKAGVLEDGIRTRGEVGTPQGGNLSPLLANIYLHYVFDLWTHQWRQKHASSDVIVVRYADDFIVAFHLLQDAKRFRFELKQRLQKFGLNLHPEKTRLIEFGRFVYDARRRRGDGKPETFQFLGFTHMCGTTKDGMFTVLRRTSKKKMQAKLRSIRTELRRRMHMPIRDVGKWLRAVVTGHFNYYGVPTNGRSLNMFRQAVTRHWFKTLRRRSQRSRMTWKKMSQLVATFLPSPRLTHPYPLERLHVTT
jgi:RNA-directed DNA polymerase